VDLVQQALTERPDMQIPKEAPIVQFRRDAQGIEAALPPVAEGYTRLWRGNRPGEIGQNPSFTNDLPGIALPFRKGYGGRLSYVDVPTRDLPQYENHGAVAAGAEFTLPKELAAGASEVVPPGESPTVPAREALDQVNAEAERTQVEAPLATSAAVNCFLRKGS
jgi:hypothetical protein